jgi:hypothetical protein
MKIEESNLENAPSLLPSVDGGENVLKPRFEIGVSGSGKKYPTPELLSEAIEKYFEKCDEAKKPYTMSGLALSLGFSERKSLLNYKKEPGYEMYFEVLNKAKLRMEAQIEEYLMTKQSVAGIIFNAKNNYGFTDTQTIDLTSKNAFLTQLIPTPAEQIKQKSNDSNNSKEV